MPTTILTQGRVTWTSIVNPDDDDIRQLSTRYPQFHPLNLEDCRTETEFPKLDHHDDYLFLVVHFPLWDEKRRIVQPTEVDVFVAKGTLVTAHTGNLPPLVTMLGRVHSDEAYRAQIMGRGASPLLYELLSACMTYCVPFAERLDHALRHVEEDLFNADTRHTLTEVAVLRREVIALRRILRPQVTLIKELAQGNWPFIHEDLDLYWGDVSGHLAQLCTMLDEQAEVVNGLSETVDTLASHRIDEVVRVLTVVTVITLPLTVLSTVFGMNVALPYEQHPWAFFILIVVGLVVTAALVWYLRSRRWL